MITAIADKMVQTNLSIIHINAHDNGNALKSTEEIYLKARQCVSGW